MDDTAAMRIAIEEAQRALEHDDVPIGAIALIDGQVVARRHNERELQHDPTAHAEILALRDLAEGRDDWRLSDVTVVVTLEPCAMCAGALVNARVARVVFGTDDPKAGALGSLYNLGSDPRLNHEFEITGGVLADECATLLRDFFSLRRR